MSHTPFPHISEFNSFFGVFDSSTQTPISPICRTPLFPTSQHLFLFPGEAAEAEAEPIAPEDQMPMAAEPLVAEPIAEPLAEPLVEPMVEPLVEPIVEPVMEEQPCDSVAAHAL